MSQYPPQDTYGQPPANQYALYSPPQVPYGQPQGYESPPIGVESVVLASNTAYPPYEHPSITPTAYTRPVENGQTTPTHGGQGIQMINLGGTSHQAHLDVAHADGENRFNDSAEYRDVFWFKIDIYRDLKMILFYLHIASIAVILGINVSKMDDNVNETSDEVRISDDDIKDIGAFFLVAVITSTILAIISLELMKRFPRALILIGMTFSVLLHIGAIVLAFMYANISSGVILSIFLIVHGVWVFMAKSRIPFSASMLEAMIDCINAYPAMMLVPFFVLLIQIAWLALWIFTATILLVGDTNSDEDENAGQIVLYVYLLLSYLWTNEVLRNVVHVTVAGTTATWYFHATERKNPTLGAMKRATTSSFGSICLGSLLISIIRVMRFIVQSAKNQGNSEEQGCLSIIIFCLAECILRLFERALEIFNYFAYIQVAIYGTPYVQAGKDAMRIFKSNGIDVLVNFSLIDGVLVLFSIISGLITAVAVGVWYGVIENGDKWFSISVLGFFVGYVIMSLVLSVVESGANTIFICFAEDPQALNKKHPGLFKQFKDITQPAPVKNANTRRPK